ncbi:proline transporter 1-like isoform X1 [Chenopodium quinoa]|uniref:proline transporter 1-like isoform X1 n=2 Tax=Chenopodium quinoa TaxID=63459 RepID=UPI000B798CFE|nr:proline transporter 1-like isoform X1 [Chenopodium quinoa]
MEITESKIRQQETLNIESGSIRDDQNQEECPTSAHTIGNDSWQQVSLMLITSFNCGWILSFSNLMLVPLGWVWGIVCLVLVGFFSCYSSCVLAGFHFIQGQRFIRYRDVMGYLFGKKLYYVTYMLQFSTFILSNMGFILLGGRALKEINLVFSETALRLQYYIIITGVVYCIFAFVVPNMSAMRVWVGASTFLTFGFIGVLLAVSAKDGNSNRHRNYEVRGSTVGKVFNALGAVSAMIVSNNSGMVPEIQSTLQKPVVRNMRIALCTQYTVGLMVYYGVSIYGYWLYGSDVPDYLPMALSGPKWAKILINLAVFLQNVISQHMFFQPVHEALDTKFLKVDESTYSRRNIKRRILLRVLVFTGNTLVTAAIPFMGDFMNLLGSFTLVTLTFIFPSMIYIKVKGKTARTGMKAWHWILIIVFSILAVATTISAVRLIINNVRNYELFANQ